MKNNILLLIFLFISSSSNAQIPQEKYQQAIDRIKCLCFQIVSPQSKIDCDSPDFSNKKISELREPNSVKLVHDFEKLKNDNTQLRKTKEEMISYLSENIFTDVSYQNIMAFAKKREGNEALENLKVQIKSELQNILKKDEFAQRIPVKEHVESTAKIFDANDSTAIISETTIPIKENTFFSLNFWTFAFLTLFSIVFYILYAFFKKLKKHKTLSENRKKTRENLPPNTSKLDEARNHNKLELELQKLDSRVRLLEIEEKTRLNQPQIIQEADLFKAEIKKPNGFYISTPIEENTFKSNDQTELYIPGTSLYKFTLDVNDSNKATFAFVCDEYGIQLAVNYPQLYIDTVCEPVNALNQNASKIHTVADGKAEKRADKWIVIEKAKIKYQ